MAVGDTGCKVSSTSIPTAVGGKTQKVPVGARFTIAGETAATVHVVTARTQDGTNVDTTTDITFCPALGAGTYAMDAAITFLPQQLEVKIGEGNITYTEKSDYTYLLDRDNLDTVKEGKDVPLDVKWDSVYEFITTGTSEEITPMDALKGIGAACGVDHLLQRPLRTLRRGHRGRAGSALRHRRERNHALPRLPLGAARGELQGRHDCRQWQVQRHPAHRDPHGFVRRLPGPL